MFRKKQVVLHALTIVALLLSSLGLLPVAGSIASPQITPATQPRAQSASTSTDPAEGFYPYPAKNGVNSSGAEGVIEGDPLDRDYAFYSRRSAHDPNTNFTLSDAAALRAQAADQLAGTLQNRPAQPAQGQIYSGAWTSTGPNPMVLEGRGDGSFDAMAGRIGALAIRSSAPFTMYLGGAQGGVWTLAAPYTGTWTPRTDDLASLAIGAIALAPSNENIVYVGTGEGALSGDSYFGNGVLKSTDGGNTFTHISGTYFTKTSISKIVVDPANPNTLYAGTLRGRGGIRRTSPPDASIFGVYKSTDGGVSWTVVLTASTNVLALSGITDMAMDPQNSQVIYASLLGRGISKTVDGGVTWTTVMNGLPANANYAVAPTRFALGISHPSVAVSATLYTGFEWYDTGLNYQPSTVWKSTDEGGTWAQTTDTGNVVAGYCGTSPSSTQCFYDNVIDVDPISPTIVYALGLYDYGSGSGGVFRSMDGGTNWVDLGFNLHPDYHAIAIRRDNPSVVVIGNDGGAWWSSSRGGRLSASDPITATTWNNLNGVVDPGSAAVISRSGLALGQFGSVTTNPAVANRYYGGLQDNGTQRKSTGSSTWFDVASGDGGQVLIDPTNANFLFGTYYGISPYRFTEGGGLYFGGTSNRYIRTGINLNDRSEFYIPWIMDPANSNRLYLGTYRVYRTDNAETPNAPDVLWNTISGDLTSGCTGSAPNGGRGCVITSFGKSAGANALYVGTEEGWMWLTTDATVSSPVWQRIDITGTTPGRPVSAFAVDRSNYRTAYVAFNGFDPATPATPGHVFKTTNAGQSWTNITNNLPDVPVNSIDVDPSDANTLYAGTDIGPFVSNNNGGSWAPMGSGFPIVTVHQMAINPFTRQIVAATHGRGVWSLTDNATELPALQISKSTNGLPVGPGTDLQYAVTIKNYGNVTATNVVITDPVPANTTFVSAGSGGALNGGNVVFTLPTVPPPSVVATGGSLGVGVLPGQTTVTFTVHVASTGVSSGSVITNDGYMATSAQGPGAVGSPFYVTLSPANSVKVTPTAQADGTNPGKVITYVETIQNMGYLADKFNLTTTGNAWPVVFWNATQTSQITQTTTINSGSSLDVVVQVTIPAAAANEASDTANVKVTSVSNAAVSASVSIKTTAFTLPVLLVDDSGQPDILPIYTAALNASGALHNVWDISADPNLTTNILKAHKVVVWYTGPAYPDPIGPYEPELAAFLNGGGRLFMSGQDILDQSAGTAPFVLNYLHVLWDGTERFNDAGTFTVTGVLSSPVTSGFGPTPLNFTILGGVDFSDVITPTAPAINAFTGIYGKPAFNGLPDALTVDTGTYKVMFLAFPFETMGTASDRSRLMGSTLTWFGQLLHRIYLPIISK